MERTHYCGQPANILEILSREDGVRYGKGRIDYLWIKIVILTCLGRHVRLNERFGYGFRAPGQDVHGHK